jgi:hypothetical protein
LGSTTLKGLKNTVLETSIKNCDASFSNSFQIQNETSSCVRPCGSRGCFGLGGKKDLRPIVVPVKPSAPAAASAAATSGAATATADAGKIVTRLVKRHTQTEILNQIDTEIVTEILDLF